MDIATIEVTARPETGRNQVARLREQGRVPAVLYGLGRDSLSLSVDEREFERHVRQHHKLFKLAMDGKEQAIFLHDVQWDILTDRPLHLDFLRIDLDKPMHVSVELAYLGHPKGISKGGRFVKDLADLKVVCLPAAIPDSIELRVGELDLAEKIVGSDLELPEGVTLDLPGDTVVCHVTGEILESEDEGEGEGDGEAPTEPEVVAKGKGDDSGGDGGS